MHVDKPPGAALRTHAACPSIYKTAGGETVYEIADAHKVTFAQILAVNPMLLDPSTRLEAGVAVLIPCTTTAREAQQQGPTPYPLGGVPPEGRLDWHVVVHLSPSRQRMCSLSTWVSAHGALLHLPLSCPGPG